MFFVDKRLVKIIHFLLGLTILLSAIEIGCCEAYQQGQPGGEWSGEEIDIVKEKVNLTHNNKKVLCKWNSLFCSGPFILQILQMLKCAQRAQIGKSYARRSNLHNCIDSNGKICFRGKNVTQSKELLNESKEGLDCWGVGIPQVVIAHDK